MDLEDLWRQVFSVGIERDELDLVFEYEWNFSNLKGAFEEGGLLHGKKVYLFSSIHPQLLHMNGESKVICIPAVIAIVSPFSPSDKIAIKSTQRYFEEKIVDMNQMKMDWVPYGQRESQIFILSWAGLNLDKSEYCLAYVDNPFKEDDENTIVDIIYPIEQEHVVCVFDWELDELEEFTNELITEEKISKDEKEAFKEFVREKVREGKRANREARENREEMSQEEVDAFNNMKFYKFYPVALPADTVKSPFINSYYGNAHQVL